MGFEIVKKQKLIENENDDEFGYSVAISGDYCIVGDYYNTRDDGGGGAAFIYKRDYDGHWKQVQKLIGDENDTNFGSSVAISGDYCIVGNSEDDGADPSGSTFIYKRQYDGHWKQVQKLIGNDNDTDFGISVAIDGNYCIVGDIDNNTRGNQQGAAFIYKRQYDGHWKQVQKLIGNENDNEFGRSVAIDGNYCIVADNINNRDDGGGGAAFIYKRQYDGHWKQVQKLIGNENDNEFGGSVAIDGNYCIVGDNNNNTRGNGEGAAFIYKRDYNGHWQQVQKLIGDENDTNFGSSVAISGDYCIVGNSEDDEADPSGSAFIYKRDYNGHWKQVQKLTGDDNDVDFGWSVAIDGKHFMVGDLDNNTRVEDGFGTGAAFIYKFR